MHSQNKIIDASKLPSQMEGYKMEYQQNKNDKGNSKPNHCYET